MAQGILLVNPNVLHKIVERVLQELLEAQPAWDGGHARRKELAEDPRGVFAAPSREVALGLASESVAREPPQGR